MDKIKCHSCGKALTTDSTYTLNCKNCYTHSERMLKEEVKNTQENDAFHFNNIYFDDVQQKVLITLVSMIKKMILGTIITVIFLVILLTMKNMVKSIIKNKILLLN